MVAATLAALRVEYPSQMWIGGAVACRNSTGPPAPSSGFWVHDGFQRQAAPDNRNNANLVKRKTPCARVKIETTMRSDAGSTAPTGSGRVRLTSAIPTCETCLMTNTCAGGSICPRGSDQTAQRDTTASTQSVTELGDSAHGNVDETHFGNNKFQVRFDEVDVGFSMLSAGKTSQQSNWLEGYQVMLPGPGEETRTCAKDSNVAKLEENCREYWLPGSAADNTDGAP